MNARAIFSFACDLIVYGIKATFKKITCTKSGVDVDFKENEQVQPDKEKEFKEIAIEF